MLPGNTFNTTISYDVIFWLYFYLNCLVFISIVARVQQVMQVRALFQTFVKMK